MKYAFEPYATTYPLLMEFTKPTYHFDFVLPEGVVHAQTL